MTANNLHKQNKLPGKPQHIAADVLNVRAEEVSNHDIINPLLVEANAKFHANYIGIGWCVPHIPASQPAPPPPQQYMSWMASTLRIEFKSREICLSLKKTKQEKQRIPASKTSTKTSHRRQPFLVMYLIGVAVRQRRLLLPTNKSTN